MKSHIEQLIATAVADLPGSRPTGCRGCQRRDRAHARPPARRLRLQHCDEARETAARQAAQHCGGARRTRAGVRHDRRDRDRRPGLHQLSPERRPHITGNSSASSSAARLTAPVTKARAARSSSSTSPRTRPGRCTSATAARRVRCQRREPADRDRPRRAPGILRQRRRRQMDILTLSVWLRMFARAGIEAPFPQQRLSRSVRRRHRGRCRREFRRRGRRRQARGPGSLPPDGVDLPAMRRRGARENKRRADAYLDAYIAARARDARRGDVSRHSRVSRSTRFCRHQAGHGRVRRGAGPVVLGAQPDGQRRDRARARASRGTRRII